MGGGSSNESVDLAARLGLGLMLPSVLAAPPVFLPFVERYRERFLDAGHDANRMQVGCCSHVICGSPAEAVDRISEMREILGLDVHLSMFDHGGLPASVLAETTELFAAEVIPKL